MFGQLSDRFWLWLDPLPLDRLLLELLWVVLVVLELEDDELPLAAFAMAAPLPATTPRAAIVARAIRALLIGVHLLCSFADPDE